MPLVTLKGRQSMALAGVEFHPGRQRIAKLDLELAAGVMVDTKHGPKSYFGGLVDDGIIVVEGVNDRPKTSATPEESPEEYVIRSLRMELDQTKERLAVLTKHIETMTKHLPPHLHVRMGDNGLLIPVCTELAIKAQPLPANKPDVTGLIEVLEMKKAEIKKKKKGR